MSIHPSKLSVAELIAQGLTGAQCLYDPELHTGPAGTIETPEETAARVDVAREVCLICPVLFTCLNRAAESRPRRGVWAALTADTLTEAFSRGPGNPTDTKLGEVA